MSNKCSLCNKEYNKQYLSSCPVCGFGANKELKQTDAVSNTDKLQACKWCNGGGMEHNYLPCPYSDTPAKDALKMVVEVLSEVKGNG